MTKLDDAKTAIVNKIKAKELVINVEFDGKVHDIKPFGYIFYRLNIFHINEDGETTFSAKGVYIKTTTGEYYMHPGGVATKALAKKVEEDRKSVV